MAGENLHENRITGTIPDLGLREDEYAALRKGLIKLSHVPDEVVAWDAKLPDSVGLVDAVFQTQEKYVRGRKRSRRGAIALTTFGLVSTFTGGTALWNYQTIAANYDNWQEARRLEQDAVLAKEAADKLSRDKYLEAERQVSLRPTPLSKDEWRILYPQPNPSIFYIEQDKPVVFSVKNGGHLKWDDTNLDGSSGTSMHTSIYISDFIRPSDGIIVPKFSIKRNEGPDDEWIARANSTQDIDATVVILEFTEGSRPLRKYLDITREQVGNDVRFDIRSLKPVTILPRK